MIASEQQRPEQTGIRPVAAHASATTRLTRKASLRTSAVVIALVLPTSGAAALAFAGPAAAAPSPATSAAPVAPGVVSLRPEHPAKANPTYFVLKGTPGKTLRDAVVIANDGDSAVSLSVSPVDGLTGQTSGSVYGNKQDLVRKAGRWVTPQLTALTLAPHTSRTVAITVAIPAGASPGDHLAGLAVENTESTTSSNGFPIKQILRSVIGVLVEVPGGTGFTPQLKSASISGIGATGVGAVDITLANSGQHLGKPSLTVKLDGPSGYSKSQTRDLDTVLPGDTISYPFAWPDKLKPGKYTVTASLTGGELTARLTKATQLGRTLSGVNQQTEAANTSSGTPWWQWAAIVAGAAVIFALVLGFVLRRGSGGPRGPRGPGSGSGGQRRPVLPGSRDVTPRTPVGTNRASGPDPAGSPPTPAPLLPHTSTSTSSTGHLRPGWQA